jgi:hypothetical protein
MCIIYCSIPRSILIYIFCSPRPSLSFSIDACVSIPIYAHIIYQVSTTIESATAVNDMIAVHFVLVHLTFANCAQYSISRCRFAGSPQGGLFPMVLDDDPPDSCCLLPVAGGNDNSPTSFYYIDACVSIPIISTCTSLIKSYLVFISCSPTPTPRPSNSFIIFHPLPLLLRYHFPQDT